MSISRSVPVTLKLQGEAETRAIARVKDWDGFDRVRRAVALMGICWAAAGICIFFPIVHFIAVPGFLLAGPVLFGLKLTEKAALEALDGPCPRCKKPGHFSVGGRFTPVKNVTCDGCGNLLQLTAEA